MRTELTNWKLSGSWPYTVLAEKSVETGAELKAVTRTVDASVPGSVYADLLKAGIIDDPYYAMDSLKCEWVANRWWTYSAAFEIPPEMSGKALRLVFTGIDYKAHIFLNGVKLAEHTGMYTKCIIDITGRTRDGRNALSVVIESAPDEMGQIGYTSKTYTQKARFGYKWDFSTRLVNLGLYDRVFLEACDEPIRDVDIRWNGEALSVSSANGYLCGELLFDGETVASDEGAELVMKLARPRLWYPNGSGEQPLYLLRLKTHDDEREFQVGLRTLSYDRCDGAVETALPYIPVVNGRRIYIRGVNMTPLDHMYGCVGKERYEGLLRLAKDGNVNLIRVWGGGLIEKEEFYDICDRLGIMVWQEFIQSSSGLDNVPSKRPEFLRLAAATAEEAVREKRNHVSLTFWSGGNELFDSDGAPITYADENIAMLKGIVGRLDPGRLMLPSSPSGPTAWFDGDNPWRNQDVHGEWKYEGVEKHYSKYNNSTIQLHSEFGVDGMSNMSALVRILPPEDRGVFTMRENPVWKHHGEWWDTYEYREKKIFGEIDDLGELVGLSQFMQAEGIRYAVEANRRRKFRNCGSIIWQLNEPWPNVSCTCLVDYYGKPKLAWYFCRDAYKPLHISMRYDKLVWRPGEIFRGQIFVHDDEAQGYDSAEATLIRGGERTALGENFELPVGENGTFEIECVLRRGAYTDVNRYLFFVTDGMADRGAAFKYIDEYMEKQL